MDLLQKNPILGHITTFGGHPVIAAAGFETLSIIIKNKLSKKAIEVVKKKKTNFFPTNWSKTYFQWMNNIEPWCISRQLWWGHQIPAWYGPDKKIFVAVSEKEVKKIEITFLYPKKKPITYKSSSKAAEKSTILNSKDFAKASSPS